MAVDDTEQDEARGGAATRAGGGGSAAPRHNRRLSDKDEARGGAATRAGGGGSAAPRHSRRLSDKILIAFHHACDQGDFEVAERLLGIVEMMLTRRPTSPDTNRRRHLESLVAAHERLWHLRHPEPVDR